MTKRKEYGPMDINYRVRCVKTDVRFDRIFYGIRYAEYSGPGRSNVFDVTDNFRDKCGAGRTRFNGEERQERHYFTKDLKRDEVIDALCRVQGSADALRVGASDAPGGKEGAREAAAGGRRSGSGAGGAGRAYDYEEEACPGHVASPEDSKVCDRCGTHIDSLRPDEEDFEYE